MKRHTFNTLMRRLSKAGFDRDFVRRSILPDWWDDSCEQDIDLLTDIEIRVTRFLEISLNNVRDTMMTLHPPSYPNARLRRRRDIEKDRLEPAIHSALQISGAVVRSSSLINLQSRSLPPDGLEWRNDIKPSGDAVTLDEILSDLWSRGIPIVPLQFLPSPSFQGLACIVEDHPVIVLGHKFDEPGRVAHFVAHEVGHIAANDCAPDQPIVDEQEDIVDLSDIEINADRFATRFLVGQEELPDIDGSDFRNLAENAINIEEKTGADASAIIFAWASQTRDYSMATMAVRALYRGSGARQLLRKHFDSNVDLNLAAESDRALLRCVYGDTDQDAVID
ncbi:hypothetical protein CEE37_06805 [candidate division LCP-89 bacterium B3_LCP]|uniref:IrrE N-terminal-like domain-containing protein n=1 Tax=candidate division LCP-89 bacterium B3_LCP TaxID=2012998 RepID=A0A532V127_UNCL8|nr:MAG: hypothetical protein CEE37_06805 [candidate division LCP-89 bacterium B3_LCP]